VLKAGEGMPLKSGKSKAVIAHNIAVERRSGKRKDVAVAIAYSKAGLANKKRKRK